MLSDFYAMKDLGLEVGDIITLFEFNNEVEALLCSFKDDLGLDDPVETPLMKYKVKEILSRGKYTLYHSEIDGSSAVLYFKVINNLGNENSTIQFI